MILYPAIPVLRVFDASFAQTFYVDWLGFHVDWAEQAEPGAPVYLQISRGPVVLHLSEHYDDCYPGSKCIINVADVEALYGELRHRVNPKIHMQFSSAAWSAAMLEIIDPFGNRLCFSHASAKKIRTPRRLRWKPSSDVKRQREFALPLKD
jgi:uncharacterized glyoxalase superfamily protein PhnB